MVSFGKLILLSGWPTLYPGAPTPGTKAQYCTIHEDGLVPSCLGQQGVHLPGQSGG